VKFRDVAVPFTLAVATGVTTAYFTSRLIGRKVSQALTEPPSYRVSGPPVSIVIPALEEEDYLPALLTTIANQTYEPIEVIVADSSSDLSRERTEKICSTFGAKYIGVPILNISLARNEGARQAQGDILVFVDSDCMLAHDYIEQVVYALEHCYILAHGVDPNIDGFFGAAAVLGSVWFKTTQHTTGRGVGIWRDAFWAIGGYDEACDPTEGCREDLRLGAMVKARYGLGSMILLPGALVVTSPRRGKRFPLTWSWEKARGVRNHIIEV